MTNNIHRKTLKAFSLSACSALALTAFATLPAIPEEGVARTGVFEEHASLPSCDNAWSSIKSGIDKAYSETAGAIASEADSIAKATTDLAVHGNPDGIADFAASNWNEAKEAAKEAGSIYVKINAITSKYAVYQLLPDGKVKSFLDKANNTVAEMQGAMPLQTLEGFQGDVSEIGSDGWSLLSSINDPKEFAKKFAELNQKWDPAYTWTYLFTSDNIDEGIMRAAHAYNRQAEIIAAYGDDAGVDPEIVEAAVMYGNMQTAKQFIDKMTDENEKKAAQMMLIAFTGEALRGSVDPADHPFYKKARLQNTPATLVWDDRGSGGHHDISLWKGDVTSSKYSSCISLGDYAENNYHKVEGRTVICDAMDGRGDWWERPTDFTLVWSDRCSGAHMHGSVWAPVCPDGYTGVGFVAEASDGYSKPLPNQIACLKKDSSLFHYTTGRSGGMHWLLNDKGSGAKMNLEIVTRDFAGQPMMWAYPTHGYDFLDSIIPVAWGKPGRDVYSVADDLKSIDEKRKAAYEASK